MIQVNLLPWREQNRKLQKGRFIVAFSFFIFLVLIIWLGLHIYYANLVHEQEKLNAYLRAQINEQQAAIDAMNDKQKEKINLEDQLNFIYNIYAANFGVIRLLNELITIIPNSVTIKSIARNDTHISLDGIAPSETAITQFMQDISRSPIFNQPVLSIINSQNGATDAQRYFKIDVDQKG